MKFGIYSVYDSKAKAYIPPFVLPNDEMAVRIYSDSCNDPLHAFCKFSSDFTLFRIGSFDDSDGSVGFESPHVNLGLAAQFNRAPSTASFQLEGSN